jgi:hypothetical protein
MKNKLILFNIAFILFTLIINVNSAQKNNEVDKQQNCLKKLEIVSSTNPWRGLTGSYKQEEENKHIKTVTIDSGKTIIMQNLKQYNFGNEIFLALAENPKKVLVNKKYFSNLEKRDAIRITSGEEKLIGKFMDTTFRSMSPEKLVLFLLESQIITTYWHLNSELCLVKEENQKDVYTAYFTGFHKYCTNKCEQDAYKFSVKINKKSGEMFLSGW